ncbi:MAG: carbohydrate ABC transporter permease [Firmicutes bacterium]|jgi:ABC-type glycerol-3-phosphate transport system permease component|nr:carbohydrate ABC transporter permease [Bacillota bacterium]
MNRIGTFSNGKVKVLGRYLAYTLLICTAITTIFPFFWMVSTALKPDNELYRFPPNLVPKKVMWSNLSKAWSSGPFNRYLFNTVLITIITTSITLLLSSLGGVAFGKYKFPGQKILFAAILGVMMIPPQVTLVPNYLILRGLRALNTYWGVIAVSVVNPFGIFLVRQYMQSIPDELMDAARIDGCSEWMTFWRILLPLMKPVLGTLAIFSFTDNWNSFMWPLIIMDRQEMYTLQVGLAFFRGQHMAYPNLLMAVNVVAIIPVLVVFLLFQKYFVQGIQLTGLKG